MCFKVSRPLFMTALGLSLCAVGLSALAATSAGKLHFSSSSYSTTYNAGAVTITVDRIGGSSGAMRVGIKSQAGNAVSGSDFTATNQSINWAAGDAASKTVTIKILNRGSFSGSRKFFLGLSGDSGAQVSAPSAASVNISGTSLSGSPSAGNVQLSATSYAAAQSAASVSINVGRTAGTTGAVSVKYATTNGTAVSGKDYTSTSGALSWASGDSSLKTVAVPLLSTAAYSGTKSLSLALSSPTVASLSNPSSAAITLSGICPAAGCPAGPLTPITPSFVFTHPGTLNTAAQLTTIENHINAATNPWAASYTLMTTNAFCSVSYVDQPIAVVNDTTNQTSGVQLEHDSEAAYCLALRFALTGTQSYATAAEKILADWDSTLTGFVGINWYLNPAWSGQTFAEAGDLLNYYDKTWTGQHALQVMFNNIYLPILHKRFAFGNREFAVEAAMMSIGVFMEDPAAIYEAVQNNLSYVPTYVYNSTLDGATPQLPSYYSTWASDSYLESLNSARLCSGCTNWIILAQSNNDGGYGTGKGDDHSMTVMTVARLWANPIGSANSPGAYISGWSPEIGGRDLGHSEDALTQAVTVAEIAWNQGLDVYSQTAPRLAAYSEALSGLRLGGAVPLDAYPNPPSPTSPPTAACAGSVGNICPGAGMIPGYETLANHAINIMGYSMPNTSNAITEVSRNLSNNWGLDAPFSSLFPTSPALFTPRLFEPAYYINNFETLTHARLNGGSP